MSLMLRNLPKCSGERDLLQVGQPARVLVSVKVGQSQTRRRHHTQKSLVPDLAYFLISDKETQVGPQGLPCSQNSRCPVAGLVETISSPEASTSHSFCRKSPPPPPPAVSSPARSALRAPGFCSSLKMPFGGFPFLLFLPYHQTSEEEEEVEEEEEDPEEDRKSTREEESELPKSPEPPPGPVLAHAEGPPLPAMGQPSGSFICEMPNCGAVSVSASSWGLGFRGSRTDGSCAQL